MSATRRLAARAAAHTRWGNTPDRQAATAPARKAAAARFLAAVLAEHPDLDETAARKLADSRHKAHMADLARLSVAARKSRGGRKTRRPAVA